MNILEQKRIIIGVSGSIAIYKTLELIRDLRREGAEVKVTMTRAASRLINPLTFQTVSGNPVYSEVFAEAVEWDYEHIELARWADAYVVAPATANLMGKFAHGIADDAPSTLYLAFDKPVVVAPAMNSRMFLHNAFQRNLARLRDDGVVIVTPETGPLACGESGPGRLADIGRIAEALRGVCSPNDFSGKRFLINAGPTREFIDPVRFIAPRSTGKMGLALARAAALRGGEVCLVCSKSVAENLPGSRVIHAESSRDMRDAMLTEAHNSDIIILAAAVADFTPARTEPQKIKKSEEGITLKLTAAPDIAMELSRSGHHAFVAGFAAETERHEDHAAEKMAKKKFDLLVLNDVSRDDIGFASDWNEVCILGADGSREMIPRAPKFDIAMAILDRIAAKLSI